MLSQLRVSLANRNFSVEKSSSSQPFMFVCILFLIIDLPLAIRSQRNVSLICYPQFKEGMFSTALGFPEDNRATDRSFILATEAVGFS